MVNKLFIKPTKGAPAESQKTLTLIKDKGAEGDVFATGGERQISILYEDTVSEMKDFPGDCVQKFSCNILFGGGIPEDLQIGSVLHINEAELQITQIGRRCHGICGRGSCPLIDGAIFAKVIKSGTINEGDESD